MINYLIPTKTKIDETNNTIYLDDSYGSNIFQKYNAGIFKILKDDAECDIICFMHDDLKIIDPLFEAKAKMVFERFIDVGVLGVIGTKVFNALGGWWTCDRNTETLGHIIQGHPNGQYNHMIESIGFSKDMVVVDGCCFFVRASLFREQLIRFDDKTFTGYHHYDNDICLQVKSIGLDVAVADILVQHDSEGPLGEDWNKERIKLLNKWVDRGYTFPITADSFK